jgi:hypothetical protein
MKAPVSVVYHPGEKGMKGTDGMVVGLAEAIVMAFELVPVHLVGASGKPFALVRNHVTKFRPSFVLCETTKRPTIFLDTLRGRSRDTLGDDWTPRAFTVI